ncbi:MAG TPA: hypothetical protein VIM64_06535 [Puia sp.]
MTVKTLSNKHVLLAGVIIITIVFITSVRISPFFFNVITRSFSRVHYTDDSDTTDAILNNVLLLFIFSIVTFYWNVRALKSTGRLTAAWLSLECLLDLAALPVCILIMVIRYNGRKSMPSLGSLLNPLALAIFPLCKHLIIALASRKK